MKIRKMEGISDAEPEDRDGSTPTARGFEKFTGKQREPDLGAQTEPEADRNAEHYRQPKSHRHPKQRTDDVVEEGSGFRLLDEAARDLARRRKRRRGKDVKPRDDFPDRERGERHDQRRDERQLRSPAARGRGRYPFCRR
jgi:hypothetical protein